MKILEFRKPDDLLGYLLQIKSTDTPEPVHVKSIDFDSATGRYCVTVLPAGVSYPVVASRAKANVLDDVDPVVGTDGTMVTEYNQCRFYLHFKDVGALAVADASATVTIWHRCQPGIEDGAAGAGPWLKAATIQLVGHRKEIIDTQLYHREIYLQLTNIAVGSGPATAVDIFLCGIEDSDFQQPFMFTPGGSLEAHLTGVTIEDAHLDVHLEALPDDANQEADSIIIASTLDESLPMSPGNLSPPVMPMRMDRKGRMVVMGTAAVGALAPWAFPQVIAGHHSVGAVYATMTTVIGVANAELVWTAVKPGTDGNTLSIVYADGGGGAALTITEAAGVITVTGDLGVGVTANQVRALVEADARIWSLVHVENAPANDGTANIIAMGAAPLIGGAGTTRVVPFAMGAAGGMEVIVEAIPDAAGEKADSIVDCSTIDHTVPSNVNLAPPVASFHIDADGKQTTVGYEPDGGIYEGTFPQPIAGHDYAGTTASLTTAMPVANGELVYTALKAGLEPNAYTVEYIDGGGGAALTVGWAGGALTVTGDITGVGVTAQEVMDAVNADPYARMDFRVDLAPGNDGTANIIAYGPVALGGGLNRRYVRVPKVIPDGTLIVGGETPAGTDYTLPLGEEDTASGTRGLPAFVRGHFGLPTIIGASGRDIQMLGDGYGRPRVIIDNYRNEINDSIKNRPIVPKAILDGGVSTTSAVAVGNTSRLTAVSTTLKQGVWLRVSPKVGVNAMLGVYYTSGNGTIVGAGGAPVAGFMFWRDDPGLLFIPIDNPSKLYVAADRLGVDIVWAAI